MSDIFLSYKSEDKKKAQTIAEALIQKGYSVWWDRVIPPGRTFDDVIEENLDSSKCVVVLWSGNSVKSKWVITEAGEGDSRGILIPVLIEEVKTPLAFRRMEAAKLIDWDGSLSDNEFELLLGSIERILGASTGTSAPYRTQAARSIERFQDVSTMVPETEIRELDEEKTITNSIGMKFTLIPAGEFMMGSYEHDYEKPVHKVTISKPFYLGIYPVTQKEWKAIMGNNPSKPSPMNHGYLKSTKELNVNPSEWESDNLPVENVSWDDVQEFIRKMNEKEGSNKYRLPSEAEWEYAALAGTTTRYSFGDDESELSEYAWYYSNSEEKTHEVGKKKPNPWGLYDMHGNAMEWVQDKWHWNYDDAPSDGGAWESGDGSIRVLRGGSWHDIAGDCRSASRKSDGAEARYDDLGFRLLRIL